MEAGSIADIATSKWPDEMTPNRKHPVEWTTQPPQGVHGSHVIGLLVGIKAYPGTTILFEVRNEPVSFTRGPDVFNIDTP